MAEVEEAGEVEEIIVVAQEELLPELVEAAVRTTRIEIKTPGVRSIARFPTVKLTKCAAAIMRMVTKLGTA